MSITQLSTSYAVSLPSYWRADFCEQIISIATTHKINPVPLDVTIELFSIADVKSWMTWEWDVQDELVAHEFVQKMQHNRPLPPVIFVDRTLQDGFHRLIAADRLGMCLAPTLNWFTAEGDCNDSL